MVLAIDVGNTNIVLGLIENGEITSAVPRVATDVNRTDYEYAVLFREVLSFAGVKLEKLEGAILASVVWPLTNTLQSAIELLTGKKPLVVGRGVKTGLDIRLDDPGTIGADLVVGAVGALAVCKPPVVIVDMGTATTITALDEKGRFLGGAIVPGLRVSMEALSQGTSQLPQVSLEPPKKVIGSNTVDCMQSGAVFGSAAMLDGMISRMEEELGQSVSVVATGGLSQSVVPYCRREIRYEPDLLLKGLAVLWERNRKNPHRPAEKGD